MSEESPYSFQLSVTPRNQQHRNGKPWARRGRRRGLTRHLKPRGHDGYPGHAAAIAEDLLDELEDRRDSYEIAKANKGNPDLPLDRWHLSSACNELSPENANTGVWIPHWLAKLLPNPREARLMAWLLHLFDDVTTSRGTRITAPERVSAHEGRQCRARFVDFNRQRWWVGTDRGFAAELLMDRKTVKRVRESLVKKCLVEVRDSREVVDQYHGECRANGYLIRPRARELGKAIYKATGLEVAHEEYVLCRNGHRSKQLAMLIDYRGSSEIFRGRVPQWYDSFTRQEMMDRRRHRGTYVTDAVMLLCDRRAGPAYLLSQILWYFAAPANQHNGRPQPRTRIIRNGVHWVAKSPRAWARELGCSPSSIREWLVSLTKMGFIFTHQWQFKAKQCLGQTTLHVRPIADRIESALIDFDEEVYRIAEEKHGGPIV